MDQNPSTGPSVSVVMITYNHELYIRKAIEGVLSQQTDFPVMLLIGEDRSTDDTLKIVREYAQAHPNRIRVITSAENVGAKKNLRRLEAACEGKYVAYCEGDDYWHDPLKLQKQVRFLELNPEYSLIHTEYKTISISSGQVVSNAARQPKNLDDGNAYNDVLSGRRIVLTLTACARASALQAVLVECPEVYDPRFLMGDTQRWLELARRGKIKCLHEVTATHLLLPESVSQSQDPARVLRFIRSSKNILDHYIAKYDCPLEIKTATKARAGIEVLRFACEAGNHEVASETWAEYFQLKAPKKLEAGLYYFGSQSRWRRNIVQPVLWALEIAEKIKRRTARFLGVS